MEYDRGDSFPFNYEPFGSQSAGKLSLQSFSFQFERKRKRTLSQWGILLMSQAVLQLLQNKGNFGKRLYAVNLYNYYASLLIILNSRVPDLENLRPLIESLTSA